MNDAELIASLGGCKAVADLLNLRPPSVWAWIQQKRIPLYRKIRLAVIAEDRGIATRKALFPDVYQDIWIELRAS